MKEEHITLIRKDLIDKVIELSRKYGDPSITDQFISYEARLQYREMAKYENFKFKIAKYENFKFKESITVHAYNVFKRYLQKKYGY